MRAGAHRRSPRVGLAWVCAACALLAAGCRSRPLQRTLIVTSEPPGARVWVNDVEIGRTPAEAAFRFYGTYDVRLEREGYEPVHEGRKARAPLQEQVGIDILALLSPFRFEDEVRWHFELEPSLERRLDPRQLEAELIGRARAMRAELRADDEPSPPPASAEP